MIHSAYKMMRFVSTFCARFCGILLLFFAFACSHAWHSVAEMDALFDSTDGWIGADGAYSVKLTSDHTLWLFSDTWVGTVRGGKREDAVIVYNSAAVQERSGPASTVRFFVKQSADGSPTALVVPPDGRGWHWLQAGAVIDDRLFFFLSQIERTADTGVFGFRQIGQWLCVVSNPMASPLEWGITQIRLPNTVFEAGRELKFGAAILKSGGYLYVYGTDEDAVAGGRERHLIVARTPVNSVADFGNWEYFSDGAWSRDFSASSRMVPDMASECSVTFVQHRGIYVLVYTEKGLSDKILLRSAPQPWGPWSSPAIICKCREMKWDEDIFCYGAKAHEALSDGDEIVVSYVANSFDIGDVASDARLYRPRFIRVNLARLGL